MADDNKEVVIAAVGTISGSDEKSGIISGSADALTGTIEATVNAEQEVSAISSLTGSVGTLVDDDSFNGTLVAQNKMGGAAGATLTLRVGQDGTDGKDGFSPIISVYKDTPTTYILKVTNADGSYLTPNLYPDLEGLQDVEALVASKVDKDLTNYSAVDPITLNANQRENSFFYINTPNSGYQKMRLSDVALQKEVDDKLRTKLQTVDERPVEDWRLGDYIFLVNQEDGE